MTRSNTNSKSTKNTRLTCVSTLYQADRKTWDGFLSAFGALTTPLEVPIKVWQDFAVLSLTCANPTMLLSDLLNHLHV